MFGLLKGRVRGLAPRNYAEGQPNPINISTRGETMIAQGLPARTDYTRLGNTWHCAVPTANHFNTVASFPTTRSELNLYNGELASGKSYLIESVWFSMDADIGAASSFSLLVQNVPGVTAPTDNTAVIITSRSGRLNYPGRAKKSVASTAFAVASQWQVVASIAACPAVGIGAGIYAEVNGGIIVPPGAVLAIGLACSRATAAVGIVGVCWSELLIDLVQ